MLHGSNRLAGFTSKFLFFGEQIVVLFVDFEFGVVRDCDEQFTDQKQCC